MYKPPASKYSQITYKLLLTLILLFQINSQDDEQKVNISTIYQFPKNYNHDIYAGFLNATLLDKAYYYMMFVSQKGVDKDPIILWVGDGPGYSPLVSAMTSNGPFIFQTQSSDMKINPYSWNMAANVLYIESPCGVGYAKCKKQSLATNDTQYAQDNYKGLVKFFNRFPNLKSNSFFIAGQGYGGVYITRLVQQIISNNQQQINQDKKINLKGVLIGNGCTYTTQCFTGRYISRFQVEYLYRRGFFDQAQYLEYMSSCVASENQQSIACVSYQSKLMQFFSTTKANMQNIYGVCYPSIRNNIPCVDMLGTSVLFNRDQNRGGLHVNQSNATFIWTSVSTSLNYTKQPDSAYPTVNEMVKYGLKIYYYSGDFDGLVPIQGTLDWLKRYRGSYGATVKKSWRVWSADDGKSTSGMVWELDGITFWSVFGAGHMAAYDKPREMKYIVDRLLDQRTTLERS